MEERFPGLWHTWFKEQVVAVGWPPNHFKFQARPGASRAWSRARSCLAEVKAGDGIVVQLKGNRIGRLGMVLDKAIEDAEWNPTVPRQSGDDGEMGRRISVRWNLSIGPINPEYVLELPASARPNAGLWRPTISELPKAAFDRIRKAALDRDKWVSLLPGFAQERALSEFISTSPHLLEDGLRPYPSRKAREFVFPDRSRLDVLLLDSNDNIVIVECKQGAPTAQHIQQLRGYMSNAARLRTGLRAGSQIRGILVHGGSRRLRPEIRRESKKSPRVDLVQYSVSVGFLQSV